MDMQDKTTRGRSPSEGRLEGAAEATHFRPFTASDSDPRAGGEYIGQSLRTRARGGAGGLGLRIALPVVVAALIGLSLSCWAVYSRMRTIQKNDLLKDAANAAYSTGAMGRLLIAHRDKFRQQNPDYLVAEEWPAGDHWLVAHGFVLPEDWSAATGFGMNEMAPIEVLDKAAERLLLLDMTRWLATASTDLTAIYILDADGMVMAQSQSPSFRFDPTQLRAPATRADEGVAGVQRLQVDLLDDFQPEPVVRGVARIMSRPEGGLQIGTAVVVFRTTRLRDDAYTLAMLLLSVGVFMLALLSLVCWLAARRATQPMRRLVADMQAIAAGDYARRSALATRADETGALAQAFNAMAERLRVAMANEKENSRLESDLAIARSIQQSLLPPQIPRVKGFDIFSIYRPAKEIGGDYYDFLAVDSQHMGIVIADASGKSIPAALVMSTTRAVLRFVAPGSASAAETLARVNAILSVDIPRGMFVTAFYLILDPLERTMLCASAGHNAVFIARADGEVEVVNPGGIALGFDSGPVFQRSVREEKIQLHTGDRVLLYTDGVVECVNSANEEYSDRRVREFLRRNRDLTSYEFAGALLADLDRHRGVADIHDDTTIVTFKVL